MAEVLSQCADAHLKKAVRIDELAEGAIST
jgi:hypothetical protein